MNVEGVHMPDVTPGHVRGTNEHARPARNVVPASLSTWHTLVRTRSVAHPDITLGQ